MTTVGGEGTDDEFTGDEFPIVAMDMNDPVDDLGDEINAPQNYHTNPAAMRTDWIMSAPLVPIAKGVGARPIKFSLFPPRKPHTNRCLEGLWLTALLCGSTSPTTYLYELPTNTTFVLYSYYILV
ncbi:hypothetical protein SARC_00154 [Sphaeroforma arctica JP610]|uniref:Uncharacterized protein n=1 Tax=Sphaeroforma arctica JP610 TaxID=667725 RepID=A0A0L0GF93_9EUKA|nr:hypothetical protein SARC_00154 [Sphaeroforma arctica JP610]KNC87720.1 hypothetical protein SARC_00154 [Sphaeroforma arctica JP610]|eukprot:XP_014161622.1 hypothetical protein SARC_00154 [Sphaeroforma arctica JP610]